MKTQSRSALFILTILHYVATSYPQISIAAPSSPAAKTATKTYNRSLDADLIAAVLNQDLAKVRKLLSRKADPNAKSADSITTPALGSAAINGNLEIARVLVEAGADLEGGDAQNNRPLMFAALNNRVEVIRYFLQKGAKVDDNRSDGLTPLKTAATVGSTEALRALIAGGADINTQNNGSMSPLMAAAFMGNVEAVRALIAAGANVNARLASNETVLIQGAKNTRTGNLDIVKMLVEAGADVSVKADNGKNALQTAKDGGSYEIAAYLQGIFNRDTRLYNALLNAAQTSDRTKDLWKEVKTTLDGGANPRYTADSGLTPLMLTAYGFPVSYEETAHKIVKRSDLDAVKKDGQTSLMIAVLMKNTKMVEWLLKARAELNILDKSNKTALDLARTESTTEILKMLQNAGAKTHQDVKFPNNASSSSASAKELADWEIAIEEATEHLIKAPEAAVADEEIYANLKNLRYGQTSKGKLGAASGTESSYWKKIDQALKNGAPLRYTDENAMTSLMWAAFNLPGAVDASVQKMVELSEINAQDDDGGTALHYAAESNYTKMIGWLIKAGVKLDPLDVDGMTPLDIAVENKSSAAVTLLKNAGAKHAIDLKKTPAATSSTQTSSTQTSSTQTSSTRTTPQSQPTIVAPPAKTNVQSTNDMLKLLQQKPFDAKAAEALLKSGADIKTPDALGKTPLMFASENGTFEAVEWLVDKKVDVNAVDKKGMNALMYGAGRVDDSEAWKIVGELVLEVADVNRKNQNGKTARDLAADKGNSTTLMTLDIAAED